MAEPKCNIISGETVLEVADAVKGYPRVYVVADEAVRNIAEHISCAVFNSSVDIEDEILFLHASETDKDLSTVMEICRWLLDKGADRSALLLAVGGGITTDMAGFAASIYKRGIRFAYVPTTLLSQVDAAIGGKTGVNFDHYKNILGVIRQPEFTFVCPEVLETLPYWDFLSGAAEMVKSFIIDNTSGNYERAMELLSGIHRCADKSVAVKAARKELSSLISAAAAIKAGIVERDEFEQGERRKLNLGHTFAHAIEWAARTDGRDISHGEAVAMGTILAARVSERHYAGKKELSFVESTRETSLSQKLANDFKQCGLPVECPYPLSVLASAIGKDKKAENGKIHFVLIHSIGDVRIEALTVNEIMALLS